MHCRSPLLRAGAALAATLLSVTAAVAAPRPLADAEMRDVRGADGSILASLAGDSTSANNLSSGLAAAFSSSTGTTSLDAAGFASALQAAGYSLSAIPGYDGQAVAQLRVDAKPVTFSFDLSDVLKATTGLSVSGPSMGTITLKDFDARGTTIWTWLHH
jgi:hypothetical protein